MDAHAASRAPRDPRVGLVLADRYRLLRKIGEGGMGDVYEAEHVAIDKRVAVKLLHPTFATRPEVLRRFHREAQAASEIQHPHIAEVSDLGRAPDGCPFMVLELLRGKDLAGELDAVGKMPLGRIVRIARQTCTALAAAHDAGIVHRDLKPENIFLCSDRATPDFVKLLDFGISKFQGDLSGPVPMTVTGTALGTPYFMSPEQVEARRDIDGRTDIWALGVTIYFALTGMFPYDADNYPLLFVRICTQDAVPVDAIRTDVPREFADVLTRMLARDRNERFRNCHDVYAALARFERVNDAPRLRDPSEVKKPDSVRPGALAIARAGTILDPRTRGSLTSIPAGPTTEEARRMMDASLDLPMARASTTAVGTTKTPKSDPAPSGTGFAPSGSWVDRDSSIPPTSKVELVAVPKAPRVPRRIEPAAENTIRIPRIVSIGLAVVSWLLAASLAARGFRDQLSIVYGHATTSGVIRDGFAMYALFVGVGLVSLPGDETLARAGRRLGLLVPIAVAATLAIHGIAGLVTR